MLGVYFCEGLCLPSQAALTSIGTQGFTLGGRVGQGLEVGQAGGGEGVAPLGCWLVLQSHLVIALFLRPEGG